MTSDPTCPWLRAEGAAALVAVWAYATRGSSWLLFAVVLLAPDLAMVGYLRGPRAGAVLYNAAHSYVAPAALAAAGVLAAVALAVSLALIWTAHNGLDRMLGNGLKRPSGFVDTHAGRSAAAGDGWARRPRRRVVLGRRRLTEASLRSLGSDHRAIPRRAIPRRAIPRRAIPRRAIPLGV